MALEVVHEPSTHRYLILSDDVEVGHARYEQRDDELMITGTFIDPAHRNEGLGAVLVRRTIDDIIATTDKKVTSGCWFVTQWLGLHPDYVEKARSGGVDAELGNSCRIVN
jgi:hypothetical protein